MNKKEIVLAAYDLHEKVWAQKSELWPGAKPDVFDALDPRIAAKVLGIDYQVWDELGWYEHGRNRYEIAGLIERNLNKIRVSGRFPLSVQRFTAAHEIGHWVLHEQQVTAHRDMPVSDHSQVRSEREPIEQEADYFAACLLMPRWLMEPYFKSAFGHVPFRFTANSAFELDGHSSGSLLWPYSESRARGVALARARRFAGKQIVPLFEKFQVSISAMAYRIEELELIQD